jgi:hypothetical protein
VDYILISNVLSGLAWAVAYFGIAYRGFRDRSFGMPLIPLALNLAWEFLHAVVFPQGTSGVELVVSYVWLVMDVIIATTFIRFGFRHYRDAFGLTRTGFFSTTAFTFVAAFLIMGTGLPFFAQFREFFGNSLVQSAYFIAYLQNLVMSAAFIVMLWLRRTSEGQSLWIAVSKMLGTAPTVGIVYLTVYHPADWYFMAAIIGVTFVLDVAYCVMIHRRLRQEGRNPLTRL